MYKSMQSSLLSSGRHRGLAHVASPSSTLYSFTLAHGHSSSQVAQCFPSCTKPLGQSLQRASVGRNSWKPFRQQRLATKSTALSSDTSVETGVANNTHVNGVGVNGAGAVVNGVSVNGAGVNGVNTDGDIRPPSPTPSVSDFSPSSSVEEDPLASTDATPKKTSAAQKAATLVNRVVFGVLMGVAGGVVIVTGQKMYLMLVLLVVYQATQEYYGFITSKGISKGMPPPPRFVSAITTVLCVSIAVSTFLLKGSGTALSVAAFFLLATEILVLKKPRFSQMATSVFGLFYCGWLPSFWIKLRHIATAAPTLTIQPLVNSFSWLDRMLGIKWSIGLVATVTTVATIIAADTGAFFVGKALGRTKLTDISPKKTVEGALGGLASAITVGMVLRQVTSWPASPIASAILSVSLFVSSVFGDLLESIMKREAGMKDSGDLIPGHGGLLDRFDSYMFSGAVAFFFICFINPNFA